MAFTYNGDPSASQLEAVRFLCGDTDANQPLLQDAEINFIITIAPQTFLAAADACDAISASFSRKVDRSNLGQSASLSRKADQYRLMADRLRKKAQSGAEVFAGGLTISGKQSLDNDSDAVQPDFELGQDDYLRPTDRRFSRFLP